VADAFNHNHVSANLLDSGATGRTIVRCATLSALWDYIGYKNDAGYVIIHGDAPASVTAGQVAIGGGEVWASGIGKFGNRVQLSSAGGTAFLQGYVLDGAAAYAPLRIMGTAIAIEPESNPLIIHGTAPSSVSAGQVAIGGGLVKSYLGYQACTAGSDTVAGASYFAYLDPANGRGAIWQLNAARGLDLWMHNDMDWLKTLRVSKDGISTFYGDIKATTAGKGLFIAEGSNAKMGQVTLVAGTATVSTTAVNANSRIFLTAVNAGVASVMRVSAITNGTSFVITASSGSDTSVVNWIIIDAA
jgi:hypothetical protein